MGAPDRRARVPMSSFEMRATLALLTLLGAAPAAAQQSSEDFESITAERLREPEPGDWLGYRRTHDVTAFSPLREITRRNVEDLRPVWAYTMRDNSRWVATPIVANGLMYVSEGSGRVVAFDALTGELVWAHLRTYPQDISMSEAYPRHRGVSIYDNTIYFGTADSFLVALDARTGAKLWEVRTGDYRTGEGHAHPPLIADGKVFIGTTGGDFAARGKFEAYDAANGTRLWTFYTVPRKGEPGFETWTENDQWPPLGGAAWNTASYDAELGLVYFSTGQPTPWTTASRGPGDSLYSNTLLAVEADTGRLRWHFQLVPGDQWDRSGYEGMLVDLVIDGAPRKALITTGKIGWGVVLDRATGEFLHAFRTAYDNTITGWSEEGRPIFDPRSLPTPQDVDSGKVFEICPHIHGARNLQAPSFSPQTGYYYLGVNNSCMNAQVVTPIFRPGQGLTGVTYTASLAPGYDYVGEFVAFDPVSGERAWVYRPESGAPMTASALATAGGLVFGGTADRQFFALNSATGELLWQTRLNGDVSGAPVSYELGGKQYIAVASGGRAAPTTTLGRLVGVDVPQGSGVMWVFALPDDEPRPVPRPTRRDRPSRSLADGVFTANQAAQGKQLFAQECSMCHQPANYTGANFAAKWGEGTLGDVYQDLSLAMPPANAGGLTPATYASIVAFFASESGYPTGNEALPGDAAQLRGIAIGAPVEATP
jgi:alcohol dehydrogenase (cytochrome c)